ncbi:glycosyltransferase [Micromonospora sp. M12]
MLTIVTVLYRSSEMLAETLPTWVRAADGLPVRFIFADNWPEDESAKVIADCLDDDRYEYLPDSSNPGFAAGCNRAVTAARTSHVLLLNPDVWLPEDALTRLCATIAADPETPIAVGLAMHGGEYVGIDLHPVSLFIDRSVTVPRGPLGPSGGAAVFPPRSSTALAASTSTCSPGVRTPTWLSASTRRACGPGGLTSCSRTLAATASRATTNSRGSGHSFWPAIVSWSPRGPSPGR